LIRGQFLSGFALHPAQRTPQLQSSFDRSIVDSSSFGQSVDESAMRKAALLYNPDSGGSPRKRLRELESARAVLQNAGIESELIAAESPNHAGEAARRAITSGSDTIFACGGDGTIHNIVQVLAKSPAALAILPMGTANALAHDLGIPRDIVAATRAALTGAIRRIALGRVEYLDLQGKSAARYFTIAAGIGVDAHLFYKLHSGAKQRMGMTAYYAKAWNLWFTYPMPRFAAEYAETGSSSSRQADVTELMTVRIRDFGGVVHELAPGASLDRDDMRVVVCRTASRLAYLAYVMRCLLRGRWSIPGVDLVHGTRVSCRYQTPAWPQSLHRNIYVEADGELLGTLPAEITVVPNALSLVVPSDASG
jgi:diacylglycerol kinase (ATP)